MTGLDRDELRARLGDTWVLDVVAETGSTNADLLAAAPGTADRSVLVAQRQHAGRGRMSRTWDSPPGSGLTFSVLLRPAGVPPARLGWLPLLTGLALVDAVRELTEASCGLKWPNDLLLGDPPGKAAGILAEAAADGAVVVGVGVNVAAAPPDQPGAACLTEVRPDLDPAAVLTAILRRLDEREAAWRARAGEPGPLRADYRAACLSLGSAVRVTLPGGQLLHGIAEDVDLHGRLLLLGPDGRRRTVAAGDVVHVRPTR